MTARLDGFGPRDVPIHVEPGRAVDVGQLVLDPVAIRVRLEGRARLDGRARHAGIEVRLLGTGLAARTDAEGRFELEVPLREADYGLALSFPDHNVEFATATPPDAATVVAALERDELPIPVPVEPGSVALTGLPGRVRGSVALPAAFAAPEAVANVDISLIRLADDALWAQTRPDAGGVFVADDVPAGVYLVEARHDGFAPRRVPVIVDPGGVAETGQLRLDAVELRVAISGIARREGRHRPDFAASILDREVPILAVAGHTHGGQIAIPLFGPPMTLSDLPRAYAGGFHRLGPYGALAVSRGVGMERAHAPRIRLFCPPELVVIDLEHCLWRSPTHAHVRSDKEVGRDQEEASSAAKQLLPKALLQWGPVPADRSMVAAIAACHSSARHVSSTSWLEIQIDASATITSNRARTSGRVIWPPRIASTMIPTVPFTFSPSCFAILRASASSSRTRSAFRTLARTIASRSPASSLPRASPDGMLSTASTQRNPRDWARATRVASSRFKARP